MSASKSSYLRTKQIEAALKATAFTGVGTLYMSLHTASPGLTGTNEVSGNAYARTVIAFGASASGTVTNSGAVTFPAPTPSNWGTVTHFGIWDAATATNLYYQDALTNSVATSVGVAVSFPVGSVSVSET
jgi:hypothetical protein